MNSLLIRNNYTLILALVMLITPILLNGQSNYSTIEQIGENACVKGVLLLKIKEDYRGLCETNHLRIASVNKVFSELEVSEIAKKFPNHLKPSASKNEYGFPLTDLSLIYRVKFNAAIPVEKALAMLRTCKELAYVEPDYIYYPAYIPNDTLATPQYQYHHTNIKTFDGWDIQQGDTNIVVGITDTGIDTLHPELIHQIKYNYADPVNGIDDDGDGYIDNYRGWNVAYNDNDVQGVVPLHGNFVAGISNAEVDNITGIAGVGFKTKFLPVRCAPNSNIIVNGDDAIVYAADHGCSVINCSWGGFGSSQFSQDVINYATFNKNSLVVAAAGNANNNAPFYPASYQYVLSVSGTDSADVKWTSSPTSGSSYGSYVDVSAPANKIFSIFPTGSNPAYWYSGGTSEAAPQVSAIAALVKAQYPLLNALQIGERIRVTADDIYTIPGNASFINQLGKGRVNLLRALTEPATSVRAYNISLTDNNDNAFVGNDTLHISAVFTNMLDPVNNLTISITCNNSNISFLNNQLSIASMATMQSDSNRSNPFLAVIDPNIPRNTKIVFTITYSAGTYSDIQQFETNVNVDYLNVLVNDIGVSITSKGRIGYNDSGNSQGIGFTQNEGPSLLYAGSFMVGVNDSMVSDATAGTPSGFTDDDFVPVDYIKEIIPSVVSEYDLTTEFNDSGNPLPVGLSIRNNTYAWSSASDRKYVITEYIIKNNSSNDYTDLYAGIYADWDITANTYGTNRALFDQTNNMGYAYEVLSNSNYAGIKLLTQGSAKYYAINNDGSDGSVNIYNGFTKQEKYQCMSGPDRLQAGMTGNGTDISMILSSGPHTLLQGDSIKLAFALVGGDNLADITNAATAAQIKYNSVGVSDNELAYSDIHIYPNPASDKIHLTIHQKQDSKVHIIVSDLYGATKYATSAYITGTKSLTINSAGWSNGAYVLQLHNDKIQKTFKLVICHYGQ
jgi:hypothetical protein